MRAARIILFCLFTFSGLANAQTSFRIQDIHANEDGSVTITWPAVPKCTYHVMFADAIDGSWQGFSDGTLTAGANDLTLSYTDTNAPAASQRFYKVRRDSAQLVMSLVLDRSGSMMANRGNVELPPVVSYFITLFDDNRDKAAMVSFSYAASTDVTMRQPFKTDIKNAANALVFSGWTCADRGLTNGLAQNEGVSVPPSQNVMKVIVFFTDGMANTWYYPSFNCGARNISPDIMLWDPSTGAEAGSGCTVPATIPSIDGITTVDTSSCLSMHEEAEKRAEAVANLARSQGNYIYVIGMGDPSSPGECGGAFPVLNVTFLKQLANTPDSVTYNPSQPSGDVAIAASAGDLQAVFQEIALKILGY